MTDAAFVWLIRTALAGGTLLLVSWLLQCRLRNPARQQRLGEWSMAAALLTAGLCLLPAWLLIPMPVRQAEPPSVNEPVVIEDWEPEPVPPAEVVEVDPLPMPPLPAETTPPLADSPPVRSWRLVDGVVLGYFLVAGVLLVRWLGASLALGWLLRHRRPVPVHLTELFAEMAAGTGYRLVVTERVRVPFSVGLFRKSVVLPASLVEQGTTEELRWVLAHELTHLARQDTRTFWLFAIGQLIYFYLPWFWWLRRRVRLSQEYLADAAAVEWAGDPIDYAQFLVSWAGRGWERQSPLVPAGLTGVTGSGSDLYRRVKMMLQNPHKGETSCSRRWLVTVSCGLLSLAVLAGGVGLKAWAAEDKKADEKKVEKEKPEPKKEKAPRQDQRLPGLDLDEFFAPFGPGLDEDGIKQLRQQMEAARKRMERMMQQLDQGQPLPRFQPFLGGFGELGRVPANRPEPRLGAQVKKPSQTLVDQLDLPKDQGLVLEEVGANSAAAKAGMKPHDILLELDGKPVPSNPGEFVKQLKEIKANKPVDAVVLRKGKKETVKGLTLPEARAAAPAPKPFAFPGLPAFPRNFGLGNGGMTSISRVNDQFTAKHQSGDVTITIKGTLDQGKATVNSVVIDNNGQTSTYDSVDKVPAEYKEKVEKLVQMSGGGKPRVPNEF